MPSLLMAFTRMVDTFLAVSGGAACMLVIYLAARTKSKALQAYKIMLVLNGGVDLIYSINNLCTLASSTFGYGTVFMLIDSPIMPRTSFWTCLGLSTQLFLMFFSVAVLPLQFIYRYGVLRGQPYTKMHMFGCFCVSFTMAFIHGCITPFSFQEATPESDANLRKIFGLEENEPIPGYRTGTVDHIGIMGLHFLNVLNIIVLSYSCIIYFIYKSKTTITLSEMSKLAGTRNVQKQMQRTIYLQAAYPLFIVAIPSFAWIITALNGITVPGLGEFAMWSMHSPPLFNQMAVIMCVPHYRNFALKLFRGEKVSNTPTTSNTQRSV